jgi:hypothetical protein
MVLFSPRRIHLKPPRFSVQRAADRNTIRHADIDARTLH